MWAKPWASGDIYPKEKLPRLPLNCRPVTVRPGGVNGCPFRLTGAYFTLAAEISTSKVDQITRGENQIFEDGAMLNHIICGDFNPTGWEEEYARWTCSAGMWELPDPSIPPFTTGNALDRFLVYPGTEVFGSLLPPEEENWGGQGGDWGGVGSRFFPAVTHKKVPSFAHQPVSLSRPFSREASQPKIRVLQVGNLTGEEWGQRNKEVEVRLNELREGINKDHQDKNADAQYRKLRRCVDKARKDKYARSAGRRANTDPFELFC